jgi:hypothetical protein
MLHVVPAIQSTATGSSMASTRLESTLSISAVGRQRSSGERGRSANPRSCALVILMELAAYAAYADLPYEIRFWRTKSGAGGMQ